MMPSQKAEEYAQRGWDLMQKAVDTQDENAEQRLVRQAIAEFALALKDAKGQYPQVHVALGNAYTRLNDRARAMQELNTATEQDPTNFDASVLRITFYADDYEHVWSTYQQQQPRGRTESMVINKYIIPAAEQLQAELEHLLTCHSAMFSDGSSVERILEKTDALLELAGWFEELDRFPVDVAKSRDVYLAVYEAPWDTINQAGHEEEIETIRRRAEGSYEIRKELPPQKTLGDLKNKATFEDMKYWGGKAAGIAGEMVSGFFKAVFK